MNLFEAKQIAEEHGFKVARTKKGGNDKVPPWAKLDEGKKDGDKVPPWAKLNEGKKGDDKVPPWAKLEEAKDASSPTPSSQSTGKWSGRLLPLSCSAPTESLRLKTGAGTSSRYSLMTAP